MRAYINTPGTGVDPVVDTIAVDIVDRIKSLELSIRWRHSGDQTDGVVVPWCADNLCYRPGFNNLAAVHYGHAICDIGNNADIVSNNDHTQVSGFTQMANEIEYLRLNGYIKRGSRFIGDNQVWLTGQCKSNYNALSHAP